MEGRKVLSGSNSTPNPWEPLGTERGGALHPTIPVFTHQGALRAKMLNRDKPGLSNYHPGYLSAVRGMGLQCRCGGADKHWPH